MNRRRPFSATRLRREPETMFQGGTMSQKSDRHIRNDVVVEELCKETILHRNDYHKDDSLMTSTFCSTVGDFLAAAAVLPPRSLSMYATGVPVELTLNVERFIEACRARFNGGGNRDPLTVKFLVDGDTDCIVIGG